MQQPEAMTIVFMAGYYFPGSRVFTIVLIFLLAIVFFFLRPGGLSWSVASLFHSILSANAIPGPVGFPVVGMAFAFTGSLTHRLLARASRTFDAAPLMAFSIGLTRFIVASHPETAKEILNNSSFADRPVKESAHELLFHRAMGFAPFGEYWRNLRRISSTHLFSPRQISTFGEFRRSIGVDMVSHIERSMNGTGVVEVRKLVHYASLNNSMMSVFGKHYELDDFEHDHDALELKSMVVEGYDLLGIFNWSDHFSFFRWLDLQGVRRRCRNLSTKVNVFVARMVDERRMRNRRDRNAGSSNSVSCKNNFLDILLGLQEQGGLTDSDMIAFLWEMIFRGTDTVAILLEWILARIVLHPDVQCKAQDEIDEVVGRRCVADGDLHHLPYLNAIVKETLRMHPPGPLLSWARLAIHDTHVGGNLIPAGTTAIVNMWAITHDKNIWPNPERFFPERFIGAGDISVMGSDLRLAPFGSGRRVCPGKALGLATVQLWLAQLLQNFTWVSSDRCAVDLSECLKLSLELKHRLTCKAIARVF